MFVMEQQILRVSRSTLQSTARRLGKSPAKYAARYNSTASAATTNLSWAEYFTIRAGKRKWETAFAIPCALLGFVGGAAYFGSLDNDPTKLIMGFEPIFFYGGCTLATVGLGAVVGPTLGAAAWRLSHRQTMSLIEAREREFFKHVAKNRVDPSIQSPTNPIPDFYGEKIGSVSQYRQWLRDQAKYKKKAILPEA